MEERRLRIILGHLNGCTPPFQALAVINPHATAQSLYQKHRNKGFQYTLNNKNLSPEQRKFYEENGYLLVKNHLPSSILETLRSRFQEIREGKLPEKSGDDLPICDKDILQTSKLRFFNEIMSSYFTLSQILDYVECFCGQNIVVQHCLEPTYISNTDSSSSSQLCPIQDEPNCPVYPINRAVCCWTALEPADRIFGFMTVFPGTHQSMKNGKDIDSNKKLLLEMKPGDTLFYHPLLLHDFGSERCKDCMKAINCWFIASECHQRKLPQNPSTVSHQLVKGKRINL